MIHAYIGLLRSDGTEPDKTSGYRRTYVKDLDRVMEIPDLFLEHQVVFPDVTAPGYGVIDAAALYDREDGGEALYLWHLPEALDVHQGVVPVLHRGRLWRGVETRATITVKPGILSAAGGLRK